MSSSKTEAKATKEEKPTIEQAAALEATGSGDVKAVVKDVEPRKEEPKPSSSSSKVAAEAPEEVKEEPSEDGTDPDVPVPVIDMDTFSQILEMDDDETHEFSMSIVENYMEQAEVTFKSMDDAFAAKNLPEMSRLGHFLKGSSAALGISQVQTGCEAMQYYGQMKRGPNGAKLTAEEALDLIRLLLVKIKAGHREAEKWLKDFYGMEKEEE